MKKKILLHVCCGPCATSSVLRLIEDGWEPVLYFSNSNIWPESEFDKRWQNLLVVASFYNLRVIRGDYDHAKWREWVKGLENEPEHGKRCSRCFRFNLFLASKKAKEEKIEHFATTLTVSRFKNSATIFHEGEDLSGFEKIDFKKKDGFALSCKMAKELGLYRQNYCGCEFSMRKEDAQKTL